ADFSQEVEANVRVGVVPDCFDKGSRLAGGHGLIPSQQGQNRSRVLLSQGCCCPNKGVRITAKSNPDYWDGKPLLDGIEWRIMPDPASHTAALRVGQIEFGNGSNAPLPI